MKEIRSDRPKFESLKQSIHVFVVFYVLYRARLSSRNLSDQIIDCVDKVLPNLSKRVEMHREYILWSYLKEMNEQQISHDSKAEAATVQLQ